MNEKTYDIDKEDTESSIRIKSEKIFELIRNSEIGFNQAFCGPFGVRKSKNKLYSFGKKKIVNFLLQVYYADYTASGRPISFIEKFIEENVLVSYANTHSSGMFNGNQTSKFRNEAR